ncbi:MAG: SET domain-containing protein-lysine N-methyltransferase [Lysobacteraceae bacterium]
MPSDLIVRRRSKIHGNGVFAACNISAGTELVEYRGDRMTHDEADDKYGDTLETGHTFLFTLNDDYIIDGNRNGNIARWINHSCDPNCEAVLLEHEGNDRRRDKVFIHAKRDLKQGEELTYDYGIVLSVPHTGKLKKLWACRCGARDCTGTMLRPKPGKR